MHTRRFHSATNYFLLLSAELLAKRSLMGSPVNSLKEQVLVTNQLSPSACQSEVVILVEPKVGFEPTFTVTSSLTIKRFRLKDLKG